MQGEKLKGGKHVIPLGDWSLLSFQCLNRAAPRGYVDGSGDLTWAASVSQREGASATCATSPSCAHKPPAHLLSRALSMLGLAAVRPSSTSLPGLRRALALDLAFWVTACGAIAGTALPSVKDQPVRSWSNARMWPLRAVSNGLVCCEPGEFRLRGRV